MIIKSQRLELYLILNIRKTGETVTKRPHVNWSALFSDR